MVIYTPCNTITLSCSLTYEAPSGNKVKTTCNELFFTILQIEMAERNLIEAIIKYTNSSEELQFLATEYHLIDNLIIQEKLFERRWQEVESEMPMGKVP